MSLETPAVDEFWVCTLCTAENPNALTIDDGHFYCYMCGCWYQDESQWGCSYTNCGAPNPITRKKCSNCGYLKITETVKKRSADSIITEKVKPPVPKKAKTSVSQSNSHNLLFQAPTDQSSTSYHNGRNSSSNSNTLTPHKPVSSSAHNAHNEKHNGHMVGSIISEPDSLVDAGEDITQLNQMTDLFIDLPLPSSSSSSSSSAAPPTTTHTFISLFDEDVDDTIPIIQSHSSGKSENRGAGEGTGKVHRTDKLTILDQLERLTLLQNDVFEAQCTVFDKYEQLFSTCFPNHTTTTTHTTSTHTNGHTTSTGHATANHTTKNTTHTNGTYHANGTNNHTSSSSSSSSH